MSPSYHHCQRGFIGPLCLLIGIISAAVVVALVPEKWPPIAIGLTVLYLLVSASFWHLKTTVEGKSLDVRFGPMPIFRLQRPLTGATATVARSDFLDGWGIHWVPRRSLIWNVGGFDCVAIEFANGKRLRVGTNDPQGLADAINSASGKDRS